jgi:hypothetical protein
VIQGLTKEHRFAGAQPLSCWVAKAEQFTIGGFTMAVEKAYFVALHLQD